MRMIARKLGNQPRKTNEINRGKPKPFFNGQPKKEHVMRAQKIFNEFMRADAKRSQSIDLVAEKVAKEGNMPHNTAYQLANRMVLLERMKQAQKQKN